MHPSSSQSVTPSSGHTDRVVVVFAADRAREAEMVREQLAANWPDSACPPAVQSIALESGLSALGAAFAGARGAVVLAPEGRLFPALRPLLGVLEHANLGAIVHLASADSSAVAACAVFHSLVPLPADAPISAIASALFAVVLRQRHVVQLHAELEIDRISTQAARRQMELHEHETALAVMVQRTVMPRTTPFVPGLQIGTIFRPGASLSGDVFDIVRLDAHHTGFFLADACGHGVAAAMLTMLISRLLPMKEICANEYRIVPPGEAMSRFNAEFARRKGDLSTLITAIYAVIDTRTGLVTAAGAGHPPVVITGPRGTEALEDNGPPIGVYDEYDYPQISFTLGRDQTMLFYTDGFEVAYGRERAPDGHERYALQRYLESFKSLGLTRVSQGMTGAVASLTRSLDVQHGSLHQIDDITLMAVALDNSEEPQLEDSTAGDFIPREARIA